jgi:hypothetical protein
MQFCLLPKIEPGGGDGEEGPSLISRMRAAG